MDNFVRGYDGARAFPYVSPYPPLDNGQVFGKTVYYRLSKHGANAPAYVSPYPPLAGSQISHQLNPKNTFTPLPSSKNPAGRLKAAAAFSGSKAAQRVALRSPFVTPQAIPSARRPRSFASKAESSKPLTESPGAIPPELPPSVEAAYRKKCIQLKQRMNEVEEANDAARLRLARLNRSIQKLRLERAFLLEQLAKRTSTNVEDSEGSPSPPPTVRVPCPSSAHILMMTDKLTPLPS